MSSSGLILRENIYEMKRLLAIIVIAAAMLLTSCATDTVIVRDYTYTPYSYEYYHYHGPRYSVHHSNHWYYPKPAPPHHYHQPKPNQPTQPVVPPKPTQVPKATVRPNNNGGGSMSGRSGNGSRR